MTKWRSAIAAALAFAALSACAPPPDAEVPEGSAPTLLTAPSALGDYEVGGELIADSGEWTGSPSQFTFSWFSCDPNVTEIASCVERQHSDQTRYAPVIADQGREIRLVVAATNARGSASSPPVSLALIRALQMNVQAHCGTLTGNETWTSGVVHDIRCRVDVDGHTLTIAPGAVVKSTAPLHVSGSGRVVVAGTAVEPVVFTALEDDSVGGDTNGNGSATVPRGGGGGLEYYDQGTIEVAHAEFRHTVRPIQPAAGSDINRRYGKVAVRNSSFSFPSDLNAGSGAGGFSSPTSGTVSIRCHSGSASSNFTDNILTNVSLGLIGCGGEVVARNTFVDTTVPMAVDSRDLSTVFVDGRENSNVFVGSPKERLVRLGGSVPQGKSWRWDAATAIFEPYSGSGNAIYVAGDLTIGPGAIVKGSRAIEAQGSGRVVVAGTAVEPVVFTALEDDSVGGDTNGNGSATVPRGGGGGLEYYDQGTIEVAHAEFRHTVRPIQPAAGSDINRRYGKVAVRNSSFSFPSDLNAGSGAGGFSSPTSGTVSIRCHSGSASSNFTDNILTNVSLIADGCSDGLVASGSISDAPLALAVIGGKVSFRGSILNVEEGIRACNWNSGCLVDATFVDWGSNGPFPAPGESVVCGAVLASPWMGGSHEAPFFASKNCDGSPLPSEQLDSARTRFDTRINNLGIDCAGGFADACQIIDSYLSCYAAAEQVAWANVSVGGVPASPPSSGGVLDVAQSWLGAAANPVVSTAGQVLEVGRSALGIVSLFQQLEQAYDRCS